MPITQDRILSLLSEAEGFRDAYDSLLAEIKQTLHQQQVNPLPTGDFLVLLESTVLSSPRPRAETIAKERAHFAREAKRNNRERLRAKERRRLGQDGTGQ